MTSSEYLDTIKNSDNIHFLFCRVKEKEYETSDIIGGFVVGGIPYCKSSVTPGEINDLLEIAVRFLISTKELPSTALFQDYCIDYRTLYSSSYKVTVDMYNQLKSMGCDEPIIMDDDAFKDIILPNGMSNKIREVVSQLRSSEKIFEEWGLGEKIKKGKGVNILLTGPSGTGKTYCGEIIAKYLGVEPNIQSVASIESKWVGESEKNISNLFKLLSSNKSSVMILDEADSWLTSRGDHNVLHGSKMTNQFLMELERHNGVCIMTTNRPVKLDRAVERRIDLVLEIPRPTKETREKIWRHMIPKKLPTDKIYYGQLSELDLTGGDIKNALLSAVRKTVFNKEDKVSFLNIFGCAEEETKNIIDDGKDYSK